MEIVAYREKYRDAFVALNTEWLERFYTVEPYDRDMIERADELVRGGGMIYFALDGDKVLATCMTMPLCDDSWEMCKLAAVGQYTAAARAALFLRLVWTMRSLTAQKGCVLYPAARLRPQFIYTKNSAFARFRLTGNFGGRKRQI